MPQERVSGLLSYYVRFLKASSQWWYDFSERTCRQLVSQTQKEDTEIHKAMRCVLPGPANIHLYARQDLGYIVVQHPIHTGQTMMLCPGP
jgi:hypothetical protein